MESTFSSEWSFKTSLDFACTYHGKKNIVPCSVASTKLSDPLLLIPPGYRCIWQQRECVCEREKKKERKREREWKREREREKKREREGKRERGENKRWKIPGATMHQVCLIVINKMCKWYKGSAQQRNSLAK